MATKALLNVDLNRWSVAAYASDEDSDSSRKTEVATHINGPGRVSLSMYFTAAEAREYAATLVAAADACDANRGVEKTGACSLCLVHAAEHCDHARPAAPKEGT